MKTNYSITGTIKKSAKANLRTESSSITGALKIMATLDNKNHDLIRVIKALGNISTSSKRIEVAKRLYDSTPYYTEVQGERKPVDKVRVMNEDGTSRVAYKLRTTWSPSKIIDGINCYLEEKECTYIAIDKIEE
jgi:hypothetical protein